MTTIAGPGATAYAGLMDRPVFTLTVATSADALISPATDVSTATWASAEEQALFFADIDAADWSIMGRNTHEAADKPDRHRIVFSSRVTGWQRPTQVWLDPKGATPAELAQVVASVRPLTRGLILGGTRVHDWFLAHGAIDTVHLTIEPVRFGQGVPVFGGQSEDTPLQVFRNRGFEVVEERSLNASGTSFHVLKPS